MSGLAATSEVLAELIPAVIATTLPYVDALPDQTGEESQSANSGQAFCSSPTTRQIENITPPLSNYLVGCPGLRPFLFHDAFALVDCAMIATDAVWGGRRCCRGCRGELLLSLVRLQLMREYAPDPQIKGLIILPCANHIINLVLQDSIEGNVVQGRHRIDQKCSSPSLHVHVCMRRKPDCIFLSS
jgi:hypothetical protein